jgi:POT family proton-dependent oligopeptide transporter
MRQRHPASLYLLFFTEMWERFGFYCMEAVFVYYMKCSQYEFLRENYSRIYGVYLAGVYFAPFVGGLLAEWRLGYFLSIIIGGSCMALGYGLLSLEPAVCFAVGLACIIVGNGLFKPNISTMVGKLYPPGDVRIDAAFTIFYMGINVGALFAPIVAGVTANLVKRHTTWDERYGYLLVFAIAAAGMIIGEIIFLATRKRICLHQSEETPGVAQLSPSDTNLDDQFQRRRNIALLIFFGINIVFWMAFKQRANSMAIWIKERTDLVPPSWLSDCLKFLHIDDLMLDKNGQIAPALFLTLNPLFVIVLSPLLVLLWAGLRSLRINVSTPAKLVLGFVLLACAYLLMWKVAEGLPAGQRASSLVIVQF